MGRVTFGISPECLCHDVRDKVRRVAAVEVCVDEVLRYLKKRHGGKVPQPV